MKQKLLISLAGVILVFGISCHRESNNTILQKKGKSQTCLLQLYHQMDSLSSIGEFNPEFALDYIAHAEEFVEKYPEDPMSAEFLYKAGLTAITLAKASENREETESFCQKAFAICDNIQKIYPEFSGIKNCYLYKGMIYEDILQDYENAEFFYREFIARYPTDSLAVNIEAYLPYLGKSPEEIILENKEKGKQRK
jgi:tetratricopeptide (TPR) repeat protein